MVNGYKPATDKLRSFLLRLVKVEQEEVRPLLWSFSYFLFCSALTISCVRYGMKWVLQGEWNICSGSSPELS